MEARRVNFSFCQLNEAAQRCLTDRVILEACAMYGCPIPQTDFFANVLHQQISRYLHQWKFDELTEEEIILALEMNTIKGLRLPSGNTVENIPFFGSTIHTNFIGSVLQNYMLFRKALDSKLLQTV